MKKTKASKIAAPAQGSDSVPATKAVKASAPVKSALTVALQKPAAPATAPIASAAKPVTAQAPAPSLTPPKGPVKLAAAPAKSAPATLEVKLDVGFGNAIFVRGQGAGLTWDRGIPLTCVDAKTWRWSQELQSPVTFKVLINDSVWATGADVTITPGQKLELVPSFQ